MSTRHRTSKQLWLNLFLLRAKTENNDDASSIYTTGSIVSSAILRIAVIGIIGLYFSQQYQGNGTFWTIIVFLLWGLGAYPAWLQYQEFNKEVKKIEEGTLCGVCKHFSSTNQLCTIFDVHVIDSEPPCEGVEWEPKSNY